MPASGTKRRTGQGHKQLLTSCLGKTSEKCLVSMWHLQFSNPEIFFRPSACRHRELDPSRLLAPCRPLVDARKVEVEWLARSAVRAVGVREL
eukprot:768070-Hanusia_phi.AAC.2